LSSVVGMWLLSREGHTRSAELCRGRPIHPTAGDSWRSSKGAGSSIARPRACIAAPGGWMSTGGGRAASGAWATPAAPSTLAGAHIVPSSAPVWSGDRSRSFLPSLAQRRCGVAGQQQCGLLSLRPQSAERSDAGGTCGDARARQVGHGRDGVRGGSRWPRISARSTCSDSTKESPGSWWRGALRRVR
jgi:hypothetical protein